MEQKTLTVLGKGEASCKADTILLSIHIQKKNTDYNSLMDETSKVTQELKKGVSISGLDNESLKTENYKIQTMTRQEKDNKNNYHTVFDGYQSDLVCHIRFPFENKLLSKVLSNLQSFQSNLSIKYESSQRKECQDKALEEATKDAIHKAELIAKTSNLRIKGILSIQYQNNMDMTDCCSINQPRALSMTSIDITPEEKTIQDTIQITFEIE